MAQCAIGLDIGSASLRAAQVSFGKTGAVLDTIGQVAFAEGAVVDGTVVDTEAITKALRQLWRAERFASRKVHLAVASQRVVVREVTLPDMPAKDLALALPYQVQDVLPMPVESAVLDFLPIEHLRSGDGAPQVRGLLVAATRDLVLTNIAAVEAAGLHVASIDLAPFAVLRAVGSRYGDAEGVEALIDVGGSITGLVVHRDGVPAFVRVLLSGGDDLTEGIVEVAGVGFAEAEAFKSEAGLPSASSPAAGGDARAAGLDAAVGQFVSEIRTTLDYFAASHPGQAVERLVLTGGTAQMPGFALRLSRDLGLPVTVGDPALRLTAGRRNDDERLALAHSPSSAIPIGLALGASA